MKSLFVILSAATLGAALLATDAEAARLGGGRSIGSQRSITSAPATTPPARQAEPAAPAQQPSAAPAATGQPQPASGLARWAPMLGGLAIGGLLGAMFGGNGLGGLLLVLLVAAIAVFAVRSLARRRLEAGAPLQYAGLGSETVAAPPPSQAAGFEGRAPLGEGRAPYARAPQAPAGFDVAGFLRAAKLNFMKLQLANDAGDAEQLREFTTPELFEDLRQDIASRGGAGQSTDVVSLEADLLEVVTEGGRHWASVRFSGMIRENPGAVPEGFQEVWNLAKPADGSSGWLLAGIQQMH